LSIICFFRFARQVNARNIDFTALRRLFSGMITLKLRFLLL
jgi:hypothetical protein